MATAAWKFSVGNLVSRAARAAAAVSPAAADTLLPLSRWGNGYPDERGGFQWRSDGTYAADVDTNMLAETSTAADAPTGWRDLLNLQAGTPGLPANPPDWGTYGGRTALRFYRPVVQEVEVMPGESVRIEAGIYRPSGAAGSTGVECRVVDMTTGRQYDAGVVAWDDDGLVDQQTTADTWKDFGVTIAADASHTERRTYRVLFRPQAASYGATTYAYVSANGGSGSPAFFAEADVFALVGHALPTGTTVQFVPQPSGTTVALTLKQPSCYVVAPGGSQLVKTWRVSISIPSALRTTAQRPLIGEPWIGKARTFLGYSPVLPVRITEGDPDQVRIEGARRRLEVLSDGGPPAAELMLNFVFEHTAYEQARDEVARLVRFGRDPMLLLPTDDHLFAGKLYHGRIDEEVTYEQVTPGIDGESALRTFGWGFKESPLRID